MFFKVCLKQWKILPSCGREKAEGSADALGESLGFGKQRREGGRKGKRRKEKKGRARRERTKEQKRQDSRKTFLKCNSFSFGKNLLLAEDGKRMPQREPESQPG